MITVTRAANYKLNDRTYKIDLKYETVYLFFKYRHMRIFLKKEISSTWRRADFFFFFFFFLVNINYQEVRTEI